MGFSLGNMKAPFQLQFAVLLFLLIVESGHLVTAIRPSGVVSKIQAMEVGGKDGCVIKVECPETDPDPVAKTIRYICFAKNMCKTCTAESVVLEVRLKNASLMRPVLYNVPRPILPGGTAAYGKVLPSGYQVGQFLAAKANFVNCSAT